MHTYFDLISLPLSYLNFPRLSFFVQAWVFIQQFRLVRDAIYFRIAKFFKSISDCLYIDFANGLYSIGAIHVPKKRSKEESIVSGPRLYYFGKIKRFFWNGFDSRESHLRYGISVWGVFPTEN